MNIRLETERNRKMIMTEEQREDKRGLFLILIWVIVAGVGLVTAAFAAGVYAANHFGGHALLGCVG